MKEIKIVILANVDENNIEEIKKLEHHAEGIFEAYPELQDATVTVETPGTDKAIQDIVDELNNIDSSDLSDAIFDNGQFPQDDIDNPTEACFLTADRISKIIRSCKNQHELDIASDLLLAFTGFDLDQIIESAKSLDEDDYYDGDDDDEDDDDDDYYDD